MIVRTWNTLYTIVDRGDGAFEVHGHLRFCPKPTLVRMAAEPKVGERMFMTYIENPPPDDRTWVTTPVVEVTDGREAT